MVPTHGTCPHCHAHVTSLDLSPVTGHNGGGKEFHAVTYLCPECHAVIGAGLDPVAVANDLGARVVTGVYEVRDALKKRLDQIDETLAALQRGRP